MSGTGLLYGSGLTANPKLQYYCGRGSLLEVHALTRTENFTIHTSLIFVKKIIISTDFSKILH